jgi:hypothetical protein
MLSPIRNKVAVTQNPFQASGTMTVSNESSGMGMELTHVKPEYEEWQTWQRCETFNLFEKI